MSMGLFLVQLLSALGTASSLFLVAAGLTVIFGVTRVVNFAHGSLYMLGAYIGWSILTRLPPGPLWFAAGVAGAGAALGLIGTAMEMALLRRLYRAPELFQLLATFGVVLIGEDLVQKLWGPAALTLPRPPWMRAAVLLCGQQFPVYGLAMIAVGPVVLGVLWLLFTRTRWGWLVRAATEDREMAGALGVPQRLLFTAVFALGAALAGIGGALALPDVAAASQMDMAAVTNAFVIVVVGGLGSIPGAYLASLLIALLQAYGVILVPRYTLVMIFAVMAGVLVLRPNGLLGRAGAPPRAASGTQPLVRGASVPALAFGALVLLCAAAAPFAAGGYAVSVLEDAAIAMLFAASLHFIMGPGGMPSFGHAAWFGLGAYGAALAVQDLSAPMGIALLAAPLLAGGVAALVGAFLVRLSGVYLAMLTLAFAEVVWALAEQSDALTGGDNGIVGLWPAGVLGGADAFYGFVLVLSGACVLLLRRVLFAPFGYALRAARDSEPRARAIGVPVAGVRLAAFAIAGAAAGLSGALFTYAKGGVFPTYISIPHSVDALVMVLLGGVQTMAGPIVGALAYTGLYDYLQAATGLWRSILGLAIILLVLLFPEGLAGAAARREERRRDGGGRMA